MNHIFLTPLGNETKREDKKKTLFRLPKHKDGDAHQYVLGTKIIIKKTHTHTTLKTLRV